MGPEEKLDLATTAIGKLSVEQRQQLNRAAHEIVLTMYLTSLVNM